MKHAPSPTARPDRCLHGHEFTPANTGYQRDRLGRKVRICLACQRTRQHEHRTRSEDDNQ